MTAPVLDWQRAPALPHGLDPASDTAVDAYLLWDLWSDDGRQAWRRAADGAAPAGRHVPLLVELAEGVTAADAGVKLRRLKADDALPADLARRAGQALAEALSPSLALWPQSRFHTALAVRDSVLPALAAAARQGVLARWLVGAACRVSAMSAPVVALDGLDDERRTTHTLGIVDDGCCLAHAFYRDVLGQSRFAWVWDQDPAAPAPAPWLRAAAPGHSNMALVQYGAELARPQIEKLLRRHPSLGETAERDVYGGLQRPGWGSPGHTHGARVTHLMAGPSAPGQRHADLANKADIVFVQLPQDSLADTSGQSIPMQVLDGSRYVAARAGLAPSGVDAATQRSASPRRATLCLSLGGTAGPHNGSSMAEEALDELAAQTGMDVVVAAGNLPVRRSADPARWLHAQRSVRSGRSGRFLVHVAAGNLRHAFVELWVPAKANGREGDFSVEVQAPGGLAAVTVPCGNAHVLLPAAGGGGPVAGLVFARCVAQGRHGSLVLLAIGATAAPPGAPAGLALAPAGLWQLTVCSKDAHAATVHAWVERDDGFVPPRRPQQTWFERDPLDPPDHSAVNDDCTLSSLAHGRRVVIAAGYTVSDEMPVDGSARAKRRDEDNRPRPVAHDLAPTDRAPSLPGLLVPGFFSGQGATMRGSSAAAPQVARWVASGRTQSGGDAAAMSYRPASTQSSNAAGGAPRRPVRHVGTRRAG